MGRRGLPRPQVKPTTAAHLLQELNRTYPHVADEIASAIGDTGPDLYVGPGRTFAVPQADLPNPQTHNIRALLAASQRRAVAGGLGPYADPAVQAETAAALAEEARRRAQVARIGNMLFRNTQRTAAEMPSVGTFYTPGQSPTSVPLSRAAQILDAINELREQGAGGLSPEAAVRLARAGADVEPLTESLPPEQLRTHGYAALRGEFRPTREERRLMTNSPATELQAAQHRTDYPRGLDPSDYGRGFDDEGDPIGAPTGGTANLSPNTEDVLTHEDLAARILAATGRPNDAAETPVRPHAMHALRSDIERYVNSEPDGLEKLLRQIAPNDPEYAFQRIEQVLGGPTGRAMDASDAASGPVPTVFDDLQSMSTARREGRGVPEPKEQVEFREHLKTLPKEQSKEITASMPRSFTREKRSAPSRVQVAPLSEARERKIRGLLAQAAFVEDYAKGLELDEGKRVVQRTARQLRDKAERLAQSSASRFLRRHSDGELSVSAREQRSRLIHQIIGFVPGASPTRRSSTGSRMPLDVARTADSPLEATLLQQREGFDPDDLALPSDFGLHSEGPMGGRSAKSRQFAAMEKLLRTYGKYPVVGGRGQAHSIAGPETMGRVSRTVGTIDKEGNFQPILNINNPHELADFFLVSEPSLVRGSANYDLAREEFAKIYSEWLGDKIVGSNSTRGMKVFPAQTAQAMADAAQVSPNSRPIDPDSPTAKPKEATSGPGSGDQTGAVELSENAPPIDPELGDVDTMAERARLAVEGEKAEGKNTRPFDDAVDAGSAGETASSTEPTVTPNAPPIDATTTTTGKGRGKRAGKKSVGKAKKGTPPAKESGAVVKEDTNPVDVSDNAEPIPVEHNSDEPPHTYNSNSRRTPNPTLAELADAAYEKAEKYGVDSLTDDEYEALQHLSGAGRDETGTANPAPGSTTQPPGRKPRGKGGKRGGGKKATGKATSNASTAGDEAAATGKPPESTTATPDVSLNAKPIDDAVDATNDKLDQSAVALGGEGQSQPNPWATAGNSPKSGGGGGQSQPRNPNITVEIHPRRTGPVVGGIGAAIAAGLGLREYSAQKRDAERQQAVERIESMRERDSDQSQLPPNVQKQIDDVLRRVQRAKPTYVSPPSRRYNMIP